MKTVFPRLVALLFASSFGFLLCVAPETPADELSRYTGFTRPGTPDDDIVGGGKIRFAADTEEGRANGLGTTIYFTVFERNGDKEDVWGTRLKNFVSTFKPGLDFSGVSSPGLDTSAKYLYLYQVVNDRGTLSPVRNVSIKLIVEMKDITSWGYFSGVGFATQSPNTNRNVRKIRPVSYGNVVARERADRVYKRKAPFIPVTRPFFLTRVPTSRGEAAPTDQNGDKILRIQWDPLDPAINPDYVILLNRSDFKDKRPSFRAIWSEKNAVEKDQRSTVFGFTSNLPPTLEPVRIQGQRVRVQDGKIVPVVFDDTIEKVKQKFQFLADGVAATPQPFQYVPAPDEKNAGPAFQSPGTRSLDSGIQQVGGAPLAGGGPGIVAVPSDNSKNPPIITAGGGFGTSTTTQMRESDVNVQVTQEQNVNQGQFQGQRQRQRQRQKQRQKGNGGPHTVVPAPSAFLLAGLGLPLLFFVRRKRKESQPEAA